jgi:glycosyltransferase involved in cell wall biosynthesis
VDLTVFFACRTTPVDQAKAGFEIGFDWDVDLLHGYEHYFLRNVANNPGVDRFAGCDTPEIGTRLREGRFDVLLVQGWHLKCFLQAMFAAKRLGLSVMVRGDSHLATPRTKLKKIAKSFVYPSFLSFFDIALYVGQHSRAYYEYYRFPEDRLVFSPHCVDTEWFAARATAQSRLEERTRLGLADATKVVLFAGKLIPLKRPLDIVAAAALLRRTDCDVEVLVAGSGPLEQMLIQTAQAAGVHLHALGFRNQTEMPSAYATADVLILPSERETWGLVANEALACERPIILSDAVGAAPDLAAAGTTGFVFPVGNVGALAEAIRKVFSHPPPVAALQAKSRAYSLDAAVEGIVQATRRAENPIRPVA